MPDHIGQAGGHDAGHGLRHEFHHAGLDVPHVGEGHGDFHADEPGADDHGVLHAAGSAGLAERVGVLKVVRAAHVFEVAAFDRGHFGSAAGGDDQAVVGERLLFARDQVLGRHGLGGAVDGGHAGLVQGMHALMLEILGGAHGPVGRGAQGVQRIDFAGNIVGDAAAAERNIDVFVDHGHVGRGIKPFQAAGRLGAEGHATDDDNVSGHISSLPENRGKGTRKSVFGIHASLRMRKAGIELHRFRTDCGKKPLLPIRSEGVFPRRNQPGMKFSALKGQPNETVSRPKQRPEAMPARSAFLEASAPERRMPYFLSIRRLRRKTTGRHPSEKAERRVNADPRRMPAFSAGSDLIGPAVGLQAEK